jgi:predicted phosphodiesterase
LTKLLHLSDLHFGSDHFFRQTGHDPSKSSLGQAITDCLKGVPPDWVVMSGDLFSGGRPEDYILVTDALKDLLTTLHVPPERLLVVPGNHDLTWDPRHSQRPFVLYDRLMAEIGLPQMAASALPHVVVLPPADANSLPIAMMLLNSCKVEGPAMAGIGRIGDDQLRTLRKQIADMGISKRTHNLIAVMHHHLLPISPVEEIVNDLNPHGPPTGRSSITVDAVEVLRTLSTLGTSIVLHGHQHRPAVLRYENLYAGADELNVIAAGSCGSARPGEHIRRQFFLYEVERRKCVVRSFEQSRHSDYQFDEQGRWELDLMAQSRNAVVCDVERLVRQDYERVTEVGVGDNSDLYYLMMSVVECPRSRDVIRRFLADLPLTSEWKELNARYVKLVAMYDLLGRWDLIVRFRLDPRVNPIQFTRLIERALEKEGMLPPEAKREVSAFGQVDLFNIKAEVRSIADLNPHPGPPAREVPIQRVRMATTEAYESSRSQRGFLYIELPRKGEPAMIKELEIALHADPESQVIIESVARGEKELVLDLFMSCAQSSHVNRLNRTLEHVLTKYSVQKYTLLCYGYDEVPFEFGTANGAPN